MLLTCPRFEGTGLVTGFYGEKEYPFLEQWVQIRTNSFWIFSVEFIMGLRTLMKLVSVQEWSAPGAISCCFGKDIRVMNFLPAFQYLDPSYLLRREFTEDDSCSCIFSHLLAVSTERLVILNLCCLESG